MRGFDSHFGYLGPYIGYFDYSLQMHDRNYSRGYDMRKNLTVNYIEPKPYVTELFTSEAVDLIQHHNYKDDPLFLVVNHLVNKFKYLFSVLIKIFPTGTSCW